MLVLETSKTNAIEMKMSSKIPKTNHAKKKMVSKIMKKIVSEVSETNREKNSFGNFWNQSWVKMVLEISKTNLNENGFGNDVLGYIKH